MRLGQVLARILSANVSPTARSRPRKTRLFCEALETRDVPSVTIASINDQSFPGGKDLLVPLSGTDTAGQAITYSVISTNASVTATVESTGTTIDLNVSGTKGDGSSFTGDIVIRLFDSLSPNSVSHIISLVNSGFYTNNNFHRVIDNFMAQGGSANGDGTGSSPLGSIDDEFDSHTTFVSGGLVALANAGDDTSDSQFFITDTDLSLAQMAQNLNFNYTIIGQLVGGFDIYADIMSTQVTAQSAQNQEVSKPVNPVTINSATVITDNHDAVLRISAPAGFTGTSDITVTGSTASDGSAQEAFTVTAVPDTLNDPPFLGIIGDQTTGVGTAVTINLPATDLENDALTFTVTDPNNFGSTPANVTVSVDQANHRATITPSAGFTGTVDLLVGVRDQTDRSGGFGLDSPSNFDTQKITLTVSGQIDLNASSDNGLYNDDNYTSNTTPTFSVFAPTGMTVTLTVNGSGSFAATESGSTPGLYTVTLPTGTLQVGDNTIAGAAVSPQQLQNPITLDPLVVTFAPGVQNIFVVPGAIGSNQQVTVTLTSTESAFQSEVGYFIVDDLQGHLGNLAPGAAGYVQAAMNARHTLIAANQTAGATTTINVQGGQVLAFYLIQNDTSANFVAHNPTNATTGSPVAFFSFAAANPDGLVHAQVDGDLEAGFLAYSWEDLLNGGDKDYNDMVVTLRTAAATGNANQVLAAPAGPTRDVKATFQLQNAVKSKLNSSQGTSTTSPGEVGYFIVDGPDGAIGNLHPGDAGYAQAALNARHVLFSTGTASQTQVSSAIPGGAFIGFYVVKNGTAANVLANNPTNAANGSPVALFSFSAANPDNGTLHFRTFSPEQVTQATPSANGPILIHATTVLNGASQDFDDLVFSVQFSATSGGQPNTPPAINTLGLAPSSPGTADTLTATVAASAAENDPISSTYVWKVDGTVVKTTSATSSTTDTLDLSVAGNGDKGQTVSVEVTPNDGTVDGTKSTTSVTIGNAAPVVNTVTLLPAQPGTSDTLTANVAATDADGDAMTFTYVWKVDGNVVKTTSATSATTDTLDLSQAGNGDEGQVITVDVTPNDGTVDGALVSQNVTVNTPPAINSLTLLPNPAGTNDTLTATVAATDVDNDAITFTYVWKVNGTVVKTTSASSATSDTLDLSVAGNGDVNQTVTVEVTPNDGAIDGALAFTSVTIENTAPVINSVTLSPNPVGTNDTLTATVDATDADNDAMTFTYVWKVNGTVVQTTSAASSATDTLDLSQTGKGDSGDTITVEVTPNDGIVDGTLSSTSIVVQ